jgi:hypothetical protein
MALPDHHKRQLNRCGSHPRQGWGGTEGGNLAAEGSTLPSRHAGKDCCRWQTDHLEPWEDDDINLPWRLSLSVEQIGDGDYFNPRCYWFLDNEGLHLDHFMGYAHNASLFKRAAFEGVGGYPSKSLGLTLRSTRHSSGWCAWLTHSEETRS